MPKLDEPRPDKPPRNRKPTLKLVQKATPLKGSPAAPQCGPGRTSDAAIAGFNTPSVRPKGEFHYEIAASCLRANPTAHPVRQQEFSTNLFTLAGRLALTVASTVATNGRHPVAGCSTFDLCQRVGIDTKDALADTNSRPTFRREMPLLGLWRGL